jgi:hypothetical protein
VIIELSVRDGLRSARSAEYGDFSTALEVASEKV